MILKNFSQKLTTTKKSIRVPHHNQIGNAFSLSLPKFPQFIREKSNIKDGGFNLLTSFKTNKILRRGITDSPIEEAEVLLRPIDFPKEWDRNNFRHPEDHIISTKPITPYFTINREFNHNRTLFRISFKLAEEKFVPLSFVVDTGAPEKFYFGSKSKEFLENHGRIKTDGSITLFGDTSPTTIFHTGDAHDPANIIGHRAIEEFGLSYTKNGPCWTSMDRPYW